MTRRRCTKCGRFAGRYVLATPRGIACPRCGPRVDGGAITANARFMLVVVAHQFKVASELGLAPTAPRYRQ